MESGTPHSTEIWQNTENAEYGQRDDAKLSLEMPKIGDALLHERSRSLHQDCLQTTRRLILSVILGGAPPRWGSEARFMVGLHPHNPPKSRLGTLHNVVRRSLWVKYFHLHILCRAKHPDQVFCRGRNPCPLCARPRRYAAALPMFQCA